MIDDIRSRLASIEARFSAPQPMSSGDSVDPEVFRQILLAQATGSSTSVVDALMGQLNPGTIGTAPGALPLTSGRTDFTVGAVPSEGAPFTPLFEAAGARHGIDPDLLAAVAWTESAFNPAAVSHAGAIGLMQIMPGTAAGLGVDPRDPAQAVDGAARYLRDQLETFGGDVRLALAAYNAGPGAVQQHGGIPPYPETQSYVTKVLGRLDTLRSS